MVRKNIIIKHKVPYLLRTAEPMEPTPTLIIHGIKAGYLEIHKIMSLNYTRDEMMNIFQKDHALPVYMRVFTMTSSLEELKEIVEGLFTPEQFEKNLIALRLAGGK